MHHRILLEWLENGDPLYRKTLCETLVTESSNTSTRELKWQIRKNAKGNRKSCCAYRVTDTLVFGGNKGDFYLSRELLRAIVSQKAGSLRHLLSLVLVPWTVREAFLRSFFYLLPLQLTHATPFLLFCFLFLSFFCFVSVNREGPLSFSAFSFSSSIATCRTMNFARAGQIKSFRIF